MLRSELRSHSTTRKKPTTLIEALEPRQLLTAVTFTIDPQSSSLTLSGFVKTSGGNINLTPQSTGSLTTEYSGTIDTDLTPSSIQFENTSAIAAENNGTWLPGPDLGDYGAQAVTSSGTIPMALRNIVVDGTSQPLSIAQDGSFSATPQSIELTSGELDFTTEGDSSRSLAGLSASNLPPPATKASYVVSNGVATLTIPVAITYTTSVISTHDAQLTLTGQIVATAGVPVFIASVLGNVHASAALANVTVYADANNNGVLDPGEISTSTDQSGNYSLSGMAASKYIVRQILPAGVAQISPGNGFGIHVQLASGQSITNANFTDGSAPGSISGFVRDNTLAGLANVTVYADLNNNGKQDAAEPNTLTSASGAYSLSGLGTGAFIVRQILPVGYSQVTPGGGFGIHATLLAGHSVTNANFSDVAVAAQPGSISGTVFSDDNGNGRIDSGEVGLSPWELYIDLSNTHIPNAADPTAFTDTSGNFTFNGLAPGDYVIRSVQPGNWIQTYPLENFGQHIKLSLGQNVTKILLGEISDG